MVTTKVMMANTNYKYKLLPAHWLEDQDDGKHNADENGKIYLTTDEGAALPCVGESCLYDERTS